jgi:peroxiredoxin
MRLADDDRLRLATLIFEADEEGSSSYPPSFGRRFQVNSENLEVALANMKIRDHIVRTGAREFLSPTQTDLLAEAQEEMRQDLARSVRNRGKKQVEAGEGAPDFTLRDLRDRTVQLSAYRGEKAVLLFFWASWCSICLREMPVLENFYRQYRGKDVEFLGITVDRNRAAIESILETREISFPILIDSDKVVAGDLYRLAGPIPFTLIIDKEGEICWTHLGSVIEHPSPYQYIVDSILRNGGRCP